jgi:hypothetical protein
MGREAIEGDGNFTVVLFRVDRQSTQSDSLYGEASKDGVRFFPPIELKVIPILGEPENKSYNQNGSARYLQDGPLTFGIYQAQLDEEKIVHSSLSFAVIPNNFPAPDFLTWIRL